MTTIINSKQYDNLKEAIYQSIMSIEDVGMGEMGEAYDNAEGIVSQWVIDNGIIVIDEDFMLNCEGEQSTLSEFIQANCSPNTLPIEPEQLEQLITMGVGETLSVGMVHVTRIN